MTAVGTVGVTLAGCSSGSNDDGNGGGGDGDGDQTTTEDDGGDGSDGFEQTDVVSMTDDLVYEPPKIEVEAGTTVTWENVGSIGHTITAYEDDIPDDADYWASGGFDSQDAAVEGYESDGEGNVEAGESWEHTFETKGTHEYYCIPHEMNGMVGTVKVI